MQEGLWILTDRRQSKDRRSVVRLLTARIEMDKSAAPPNLLEMALAASYLQRGELPSPRLNLSERKRLAVSPHRISILQNVLRIRQRLGGSPIALRNAFCTFRVV